jgi:Zn-finger protein
LAVDLQWCYCPLHYLRREKREEKRKRRKFYIYPDVTHTHTPGRAGETLKGKRKKKADTRRADGQKQRMGGRGTDGPPEPTYTAKRT